MRCRRLLKTLRRAGPRRDPAGAGRPGEIWFPEEARVGQQGPRTRIGAKRGTRPRITRDRRFTWASLFGAIGPARGTGAAWVRPTVRREARNLWLK